MTPEMTQEGLFGEPNIASHDTGNDGKWPFLYRCDSEGA